VKSAKFKAGEIRMNKLEQQFESFLHKQPTLGKGVYIAKGAAVLGDVTLKKPKPEQLPSAQPTRP